MLGSHWPILQREGISGKYRLHMGSVRLDGRICVPQSLLDKIVIATHSYAHPGVCKTHQLIDRKHVFQEPGKDAPVKCSYAKMRKRISLALAGCQVVHAVKSRTTLQPDTLEACPVSQYPFSSASVDFCHLPLVSVGSVKYNSVLVIVCRLTGYVMALPCHESVTSAELASLFLTRFVTFFGLPKEKSADNGFRLREAGDGEMRQDATGRRYEGGKNTTGWRQEDDTKAQGKRQGSNRKP